MNIKPSDIFFYRVVSEWMRDERFTRVFAISFIDQTIDVLTSILW